ncbi:MAG: TPM domain-containing protein [Acidobacteria bacterium]|nr:TPM domain-containing protein [Acidobacteriota bacterium]
MRRITLVPLLFLLVSALPLTAAEVPIPPPPTHWVTDTAGFISPQLRSSLDQRLGNYARANGTQVLVWIGNTTGDTPTEDWTVRAFARWKVGQKGLDNGLVLFIFAQDHKVRIEVGYGLEGRVPDVIASRIIRNIIAPRIQAGDNDGAVSAGVSALLAAIGGANSGGAEQTSPDRRGGHGFGNGKVGLGQIVLFVILGIGFLFLLITNPTLALYLLFSILSGGRGGGGFGGGGFSGGGGRSGGGGATGSW